MKVRVYAPAFCDDYHIDQNGMVEIKANTTVRDVLKLLKTPAIISKIVIVAVNYERASKKRILQDGDVVSILGPLSSG